MRPADDPLPADGAVIQKPAERQAGALDESLLDSVLARKPRGISQPTYGINPRIDSFAPKSPAEIAAWFEKFLAAFAAPANGAATIAY
jgi:hypothetical protein